MYIDWNYYYYISLVKFTDAINFEICNTVIEYCMCIMNIVPHTSIQIMHLKYVIVNQVFSFRKYVVPSIMNQVCVLILNLIL